MNGKYRIQKINQYKLDILCSKQNLIAKPYFTQLLNSRPKSDYVIF